MPEPTVSQKADLRRIGRLGGRVQLESCEVRVKLERIGGRTVRHFLLVLNVGFTAADVANFPSLMHIMDYAGEWKVRANGEGFYQGKESLFTPGREYTGEFPLENSTIYFCEAKDFYLRLERKVSRETEGKIEQGKRVAAKDKVYADTYIWWTTRFAEPYLNQQGNKKALLAWIETRADQDWFELRFSEWMRIAERCRQNKQQEFFNKQPR